MPNQKTPPDPKLQAIRAEIDRLTDAVGRPIDEGIKETVIYVNALDLPTQQSCEGHIDSGQPWPWVRIGAADEPEEQYIGQNQVFQRIAEEHGLDIGRLKRGQPLELWGQAIREASEQPETAKYQQWRQQNLALQQQAQALLDEFYASRQVDPKIRLEIQPMAGDEFEIASHEPYAKPPYTWQPLSAEQEEEMRSRLPTRQTEMQVFTDFLRLRYEQTAKKAKAQ